MHHHHDSQASLVCLDSESQWFVNRFFCCMYTHLQAISCGREMTVQKETHVIGGVPVHVYSSGSYSDSSKPLAVLFFLHGRNGSAEKIDPIARQIISLVYGRDDIQRDLLIVTLDQRNHGQRIVEPKANNGWSKRAENNNDRHAVDMYSIQAGTARDVSSTIDFLPSYLFPRGEREVSDWGVAGISLGGHASWIVLSQDHRVKTGIPIIGCPDYMKLMRQRAQRKHIPFTGPYFPPNLVKLIERWDPASTLYKTMEDGNPFLGKKILVLSGGSDELVPWEASKHLLRISRLGNWG
ncbi:hypothetical protein BDQ17DRAFT_666041 [Cyathus striatus]|nr:hypothetical protein BDQ17DRAFT_666041 [Cyathus striatus]